MSESQILILQGLVLVCGTTAFVATLRFILRYLEIKREQPVASSGDDLQRRLDRIEVNIDTMAVEVERISESNRFVAKLLADLSEAPKIPRMPERVITPH